MFLQPATSVTIANFPNPMPVSVASLPLPSGASTAARQDTGNNSLASIDAKLTAPQSVTGPLTDAQLRATPVPVSGTVSTGGLTDTQLRATPVPVSGTVAVSTVGGTVTITGSVSVSNFPATQPVSGTVAVSTVGGTVTISGSVSVSNFPASQAVTGPLTDVQLRSSVVPVDPSTIASYLLNTSDIGIPNSLGQALMAGSTSVVIASDQTVPVSAASLPLPAGAATEATLDAVRDILNEIAWAAMFPEPSYA